MLSKTGACLVCPVGDDYERVLRGVGPRTARWLALGELSQAGLVYASPRGDKELPLRRDDLHDALIKRRAGAAEHAPGHRIEEADIVYRFA